jgi:hypothetical protein
MERAVCDQNNLVFVPFISCEQKTTGFQYIEFDAVPRLASGREFGAGNAPNGQQRVSHYEPTGDRIRIHVTLVCFYLRLWRQSVRGHQDDEFGSEATVIRAINTDSNQMTCCVQYAIFIV